MKSKESIVKELMNTILSVQISQITVRDLTAIAQKQISILEQAEKQGLIKFKPDGKPKKISA